MRTSWRASPAGRWAPPAGRWASPAGRRAYPWWLGALPAGEWASPAGPKSRKIIPRFSREFGKFSQGLRPTRAKNEFYYGDVTRDEISTGPSADPSENTNFYGSPTKWRATWRTGRGDAMRRGDVAWDVATRRGDATWRRDVATSGTWRREEDEIFHRAFGPTRAKTQIFMVLLRSGERRGERDVATRCDVATWRGDEATGRGGTSPPFGVISRPGT
jgi:hypothetical protein